MLDLRQYTCLGAALRDALDRFSSEICLIEADRDREKVRLTYSDFKEIALPLARALEDADFDAGDRAAIIMTNQSKWLISAYAIFYCGGVLVPLDYKLTAAEHLQLLAHSKAESTDRRVLPVAGDHAVAGLSEDCDQDCSGDRSSARCGTWLVRFAGRISSAKARPTS